MKHTLFISSIILAACMTACYDDKDPVADIITPTGKGFYPVSANTFTDLVNGSSISANRVYKPSVKIAFELQYWSEDLVQEVNVYSTVGAGAREQIYHASYSEIKAFSKMKSADTLIVNYTTPVVATETNVKLEVEIINTNTLSLLRTLTIKSKP